MDVLLVPDVLIIKFVCANKLLVVGGAEERYEIALEIIAEALDVFPWIFTDCLDCSYMLFTLDVAFEAVGVSTLFLACLTVPL
jgi:hypothetical protein